MTFPVTPYAYGIARGDDIFHAPSTVLADHAAHLLYAGHDAAHTYWTSDPLGAHLFQSDAAIRKEAARAGLTLHERTAYDA